MWESATGLDDGETNSGAAGLRLNGMLAGVLRFCGCDNQQGCAQTSAGNLFALQQLTALLCRSERRCWLN